MSDGDVLYARTMAHGPLVRIRRTSGAGEVPVHAVLEVDRRAGTPREGDGGYPPPLLFAEGTTESEVVSRLQPHADDDRIIAGLMREKGLR